MLLQVSVVAFLAKRKWSLSDVQMRSGCCSMLPTKVTPLASIRAGGNRTRSVNDFLLSIPGTDSSSRPQPYQCHLKDGSTRSQFPPANRQQCRHPVEFTIITNISIDNIPVQMAAEKNSKEHAISKSSSLLGYSATQSHIKTHIINANEHS